MGGGVGLLGVGRHEGLAELAGTFEITTSRDGYRDDVRTIELDHNGCHVVRQTVRVVLTAE